MDIPVLQVQRREERGKGPARRLRAAGQIPGVCYGKGIDTLAVVFDPLELTKILRGPRGLNSLIRLEGGEERMVFVQELQRDPLVRNLLHVDFMSVDPTKPVIRQVPLRITGRPEGFKQGGLLQVSSYQILVEALPAELPEAVEVDVTPMNIGDVLHIADVKMPAGTRAVYERNTAVCALVAPKEEKVEVAAAEGEPLEGAAAEGEAPAEGADKAKGEGKKEKE